MNQQLTDNATIKVAVVDDHPVFAFPFANALNQGEHIRATLVATSGPQLLQLLEESPDKPDIILMDIIMPGMNGIEVTRRVNEKYPDIKIVALTVEAKEHTLFEMLAAGACAYLSKKIEINELEEAIREVHIKRKYHADLFHLYEPKLKEFKKRVEGVTITDKEKEFLHYLGMNYTPQQMAKAMSVSKHSIRYYQVCLNEKFGTNNNVAILLEAISRGLVKINDNY